MTLRAGSVKKRAYHHGNLGRMAVQIATRIIDEEGADRLSLQAVAARAGVTPMALYRHFSDKAALLSAVGEHAFTLLRDALVKAKRSADPCKTLTRWGVTYVLFARDHPHLFRLMFGGPPAWQTPDGAGLADRPDTAFGMLTAAMREHFAAEDVALAVLTAWSFVHGLASLIVDRRINPYPPDVGKLTREACQFFTSHMIDRSARRSAI